MKAFGLMDEQATAAVMEIPAPSPDQGGPGPGPELLGERVRRLGREGTPARDDGAPVPGRRRKGLRRRGRIRGRGRDGPRTRRRGRRRHPVRAGPFARAFAELVVVPANGFIQRRPPDLDLERAASVGLAAITALASVDAVEASDGDVVLVAGQQGVGAYAVQLAARRGATVVATAPPEDADWLRGSARARSSTTRATSPRPCGRRIPRASTR